MPDDDKVLGDDHLVMIKDGLTACKRAASQIATAKIAGLATPEQEQRLAEAQKQLLKIGGAYFPGKTLL